MKVTTLIGRRREQDHLRLLVKRNAASLVLVYGRRRVGKTTLLQAFAKQTGLPVFYWESPRSTADNVRASLAREFGEWAGTPGARAPRFDDWLDVFRMMHQTLANKPAIVILDEFPWAVEADAGLPARLKTAWDQLFEKSSRVLMLITGSHISAMEKLLESDAPLFGRLQSKLHVRPLSFAQIKPFIPRYDGERRLAAYSVIGGIPDYLRSWDDSRDLFTNISAFFASDTSPYRNEAHVLISDVLRRNSPDYEAVLDVIGRGHHDVDAISQYAVLPGPRVSNILESLCEVRLVERRLRASVPMKQHAVARHARYHLFDPFLRFYYRFVLPNRSMIAQGILGGLERELTQQMRAYVGASFEDLCRTWTLVQARHGLLPLAAEFVGSDWGPLHQADVVAVNWAQRQVLVGDAKWELDDYSLAHWKEFEARVEHVVTRLQHADKDRTLEWQRHKVVFCRRALTGPAKAAALAANARVITFASLLRDLEKLEEFPSLDRSGGD